MGPKRRSLAQLQRPLLGAVAVLALFGGVALAQPAPPRALDLTEVQEVNRVQIDVSVLDPRGDSLASVSGLRKDFFEVRLDGVPLAPDVMSRVEFDEICRGRPALVSVERDRLVTDDRPTLIALADMNFLDLRMRHAVARAIEELAELAARQPLRVKVIAYTRRLIPLTTDFTSDPAEIARAGRALAAVGGAASPLGGWRSLPAQRRGPVDQTPLSEVTDSRTPPDPERQISAFELDLPNALRLLDDTGRLLYPAAQTLELAMRAVDPRPSLSAFEAVLLSHSALRGRKALVLFTSAWFDLPETLWLNYVTGARQAAQGGFAIWAVDARGLTGGLGAHQSRLLGYLTASTGGDLVRSAGRLAVGFERALAQLSCYYLFSIPLARPTQGAEEHHVDVRLNTDAHPELWRYRVRTVSGVTLLDPRQLKERRRLAALMAPDAHRFPEVRMTASYPSGADQWVTTIEVATLLADLSFTRETDGLSYVARFGLEGLVTDDAGRTICQLGDGQERLVRAPAPPARFPPTLLVVSVRCALPGPGTYEARALVEDQSTEDIGAAQVRLDVAPVARGVRRTSALRLGRNSGRDFLLDLAGPRTTEVARDRARQAFIPLAPGEAILPSDRLVLRFVACGASVEPAVILYQRRSTLGEGDGAGPAGDAPRTALFQALVAQRGEQAGQDWTCREYEAVVPERTLAPGDYGLALIEPPPPKQHHVLQEEGMHLGAAEFRVVAPNAPPIEIPRQDL